METMLKCSGTETSERWTAAEQKTGVMLHYSIVQVLVVLADHWTRLWAAYSIGYLFIMLGTFLASAIRVCHSLGQRMPSNLERAEACMPPRSMREFNWWCTFQHYSTGWTRYLFDMAEMKIYCLNANGVFLQSLHTKRQWVGTNSVAAIV